MTELVDGTIFRRTMAIKPGHPVEGHAHNFPHTTFCTHGAIRVSKVGPNGKPIYTELRAKDWNNACRIDAGVEHTIEAIPVDATVTPEMVDAAMQASVGVSRDDVLTLLKAALGTVSEARAQCVYSHRTPQALVDHQGKDAEYDALLDKLMALADARFGQIVQRYDGWTESYA